MDDRRRRAECLDADTLAIFIGGSQDPSARAEVEAHLAACEDCYELFVDSVRLARDLEEHSKPVPMPVGRTAGWLPQRARRWGYTAAGFAAALVLAVWINQRWFSDEAYVSAPMNALISAVGENRFSEARVSDPFPWGPAPSPTRGQRGGRVSLDAEQASLTLQELSRSRRTAVTLRAAGVSHLATGEIDNAIALLEAAAGLSPADANVHFDLSAALLERARTRGDSSDAARALNEVQAGLQLAPRSPAGLFNKALALEAAGQRPLAASAWREYLQVDNNGRWAEEARNRLAELERTSRIS
jgi:tetratricopeptide (TPR) repeat protein